MGHRKRSKKRGRRVPKTDRCLGCDIGQHHPGRAVDGCNCGTCGSGNKQG